MAKAKKHNEENIKRDGEGLNEKKETIKTSDEVDSTPKEKSNDKSSKEVKSEKTVSGEKAPEKPEEKEKVNSEETDNNEEIKNSKEDASNDETESLKNRLLRLQADFLNYKARTKKEKTSVYGNAVSDFLLELLPVVDNFERALEADSSEGQSYKEGVQMVYDQLMGILSKKGLKEIEALHKPFDHNLHYGVAFEANDEYEDGIVIDVLQKGYTVNDKCIRPSMVRICKK